MITVYIGLGSNLADPVSQVKSAIKALQLLQKSELKKVSSFYKSLPMGPAEQPDYINAVACMETILEPLELLDALLAIEQSQGRQRSAERWGPRTLDLDILLYGEKIITSERLKVPHSGLHERSFVLYPLHEIAPDLDIPVHGPIAELLANCHSTGLERLATHDT
jgi:2-amino-4-hydroxy-6-hydroxymethyldihydropteridine diphosphokinase